MNCHLELASDEQDIVKELIKEQMEKKHTPAYRQKKSSFKMLFILGFPLRPHMTSSDREFPPEFPSEVNEK